MKLFEDPICKAKYMKNKLHVKRWESDFMEKYGRKPNKNDIKEADISIKEAYKIYWKLRTSALEETLTDITFCDDAQDNVTNNLSQKTINDCDKILSPEKNTKDTENINPYDGKCFTKIENSSSQSNTSTNVEGVWGENLKKDKEQLPKRKQVLLVGKSSSFQLSKSKFESSTFTKRNPRKSLSSTKIRNKVENNTSLSSLDRTITSDKDGFDTTANEVKSMFGESMKLTFEENKPVAQYSINAVQQLADGHVTSVGRNLDGGWLDRCAKESNLNMETVNPQRLSGISDSGVESMESSIHSSKSSAALQVSDEDFICNSDSEEECRKKRIRNFKKQLSNQDDGNPRKRQCVKIDSDFAITQSNDIIDNETFKQACHDNASFNLIFKNKCSQNAADDNINTFKLTDDIKTNFNILNESIKIGNSVGSSGSNVIGNDKETSENIYQTDQTQSRFKVTETNLTNQEDSLMSAEKPVKQDTSRRRTKQALDSNPNYAEEKTKKTKAKTSSSRVRTRSVKKSTSQSSKEKTDNKEKCEVRETRGSLRRQSSSGNNDKGQSLDSETYEMYDTKMLQTIPRFAIKPTTETSDLVAQLSESLRVDALEKDVSIPLRTSAKKSTAMEKLEKKMDTGTMNNNFVRINLKKKVFVRGKKNFNLFKYKRNQWKQKKKLASSESSLDAADLIDKNGGTCFKCGESGHFAKHCTASRNAVLLPLNEIDESTSNFPTLEEAEKMACESAQGSSYPVTKISYSLQNKEEKEDMAKLFDDDFADLFKEEEDKSIFRHKIPQELLSRLLPPEKEEVDPLYSANEDGSLIKTPTEVFEALRVFGHESFRVGQERAIMKILSGQSTLVMLSTGSGKSLCYQLPAYLYSKHSHCITLVISPLVSLMDDQVMGMPKVLSAACLHTNQTPKVREQVMQSVRDGKVNILLVSPEAVVAGEKSTGFGALLRQLPPIAFACIDEVHCISQWSHNFRPSYLMICRVLKEKLHVKTILGLTATVTKTTAESVVEHLNLHDGMAGVISDVPLPRNLILTVSKDENRDHALIALLRSDRFRELDSVIVYCIRREECERVAALLRVSLQDPRNPEKPKAKISTIAEIYHAGLTAYKRKIVQKEFMSGKIKIVVATVAFGMGINKSDIRAVIHYNMPGTFEGYVQEVGRAGRDSLTAHCHLFLNSTQNRDKWELRRHIHANGVDRHTIRHLLQRIFIPCSCKKINGNNSSWKCPGHEVALPIDEIVKDLDITQETISTLLCYLELHPKRFVTVLSSVYVRARVSSYNGPQALKRVAQSSPPLAMAIALDMQKGISHENSNIVEFSVIDIASAIGWDSGVVKSHLKTLEWTTGADGKSKRSAISVQYDKLGLRVRAPGDLTDTELDEALDTLIARIRSQESSCLQQLELISFAFDKVSVPTIKHCSNVDDNVMTRSKELKNIIREYFASNSSLNDVDIDSQDKVTNEEHIVADVRNLVLRYRDTKFTGRAVARIFHGIQSPNYPALIWSKCQFWRSHIAADFNVICKIATREILALR